MPAITILDVPDDVRDEFARRAALAGESLQEFLREALTGLARRPDPRTVVAHARARAAEAGTRLGAPQIVAHRERA